MDSLKKWKEHNGVVKASKDGFDVIDCVFCGFKHAIPIPESEDLKDVYQNEYYSDEKPLYLERYKEDLDWWNIVYSRRYEILEKYLAPNQRSLLDIGSGPGYFLFNGKQRGWSVKGIEPSYKAAEYSRGLDLDITSGFYSKVTASELGVVDVINMSLVLEHIPNPMEFLGLINDQLSIGGMAIIVVPNDFNPFQTILNENMGFEKWWVTPPHHINYFNFSSLAGLLEKVGFEILHRESTFPIDMFLLMGDNYIGNDGIGRACHAKRVNFEKAMALSVSGKLSKLYSSFSEFGIGREIVMFARKINSKNNPQKLPQKKL
jgi:SAM-dependent methyltransferase